MGKRSSKKPITAERIERALDSLAWIMSKSDDAHLGVPLYQRLEQELEKQRHTEIVLARARARAERVFGDRDH